MDTLQLQGYMWNALQGWAPLIALVADRIYDHPPAAGWRLAHVVIGEAQGVDQTRVECFTDWEVFSTVHVWSREVGFPECKRNAAECDNALAQRLPAITGMRTGWFEPIGQRFLLDPDGETSHGILEFRCRFGPE